MLALARTANNFNPDKIDASKIFSFFLDSCLVGYIRPSFAQHLKDNSSSPFTVEGNRVSLQSKYDTSPETRTETIEQFLIGLRESEIEPALKGWRNERFSVYGSDGQVLCGIDRGATGLFGVMQYGSDHL
jgi:hypothetical protein